MEIVVCSALVCAGMFLHEQTPFLLSRLRHDHCIADYYFFFFFLVPLDVCLLLILHLSQQVDWASITSYIYIYTCIQHHMYPPNKKQKQLKTPFSPLKSLSYKNLHDSPQKKFAWRLCWLMWDMQQIGTVLALGVTWNAALFHWGGAWGWAYSSPPPIQMSLFLWSWVLDSHYAGRRVTGCRHWQRRPSPIAKNTGVECECISAIFWPAERTTCSNVNLKSVCVLSEATICGKVTYLYEMY